MRWKSAIWPRLSYLGFNPRFFCFDLTWKEFGPIVTWNWMYAKSSFRFWADLDFRVIKLLSFEKIKSKTYVSGTWGFHYLCISIVSNVFHRYEIVCSLFTTFFWAKNVPKPVIFVYNHTAKDIFSLFLQDFKSFFGSISFLQLFWKEGKLAYMN
jgi:hypothetical protein